MWVFILFTVIHAYLANIYNFAPSKLIFALEGDAGEGRDARTAAKKAAS